MAETPPDTGSGSSGGSGSTGGSGASSGSGGGFTLPSVLQAFADNPQGFVLGVVLGTLLSVLEGGVELLLRAITLVFEGSSVGDTEGLLGLADIPRLAAAVLTDAGRGAGLALSGTVAGITRTVEGLAATGGPFAPALVVLIYVVLLGLVAAGAILLLRIVLDTIPGGGAVADYLPRIP